MKRVFTLLELNLLETALDAEQVWEEARGEAAPGVLNLAVRHIIPVGRDR